MTLQQQQQQEEEEEEEEEEGVETENHPLFLLDTLYCEEEGIEADEDEDLQEQMSSSSSSNNGGNPFFPSLPLSDQDLFWDEEELLSMFSKETRIDPVDVKSIDVYFPRTTRHEAVQWMLKVNGFYGFTALTAVLAVNYLDRFLTSFRSQRDDDDNNNKPWLIHLVAIACLSLAAKVEEVHVPLLLDLQVGGTKYVFEAKTIQRMELLILSTLKWNMHPITPLSFLNHIIRMLGLKTLLHWEFLYRCEQLLLCVISDSRSIYYLPSMLATTTMMHVIDQIEPLNPIDYQDQLLSVLGMKKETLNECYKLVVEVSNRH